MNEILTGFYEVFDVIAKFTLGWLILCVVFVIGVVGMAFILKGGLDCEDFDGDGEEDYREGSKEC